MGLSDPELSFMGLSGQAFKKNYFRLSLNALPGRGDYVMKNLNPCASLSFANWPPEIA